MSWWDSVYEDAAEVAELMGIDLKQKSVKLHGGLTRYDPCIWFSGFASQGDGACFEARYRYVKGAAKVVRDYAGKDERLHQIADGLQDVQRRAFYRLKADTSHRGHCYHSGCMTVDVSRTDVRDVSAEIEEEITRLLRMFADWIYRQLEAEHDYQVSDECVDENIRCNDYEFSENGKRCAVIACYSTRVIKAVFNSAVMASIHDIRPKRGGKQESEFCPDVERKPDQSRARRSGCPDRIDRFPRRPFHRSLRPT